ncbi:Rpn family recombination-promoting nuclease/putative transposase [Paenibacillus sp. YYML68]|uniref:Rpn family recombination-promoting nuclease/putative transposase n=1 Tax=Paenibacillus sp. YYML68 TaxID=2909250 RepID=UPI0024906470|nr:Rpn family recombination-promoting nuclease/putative transposase [Paenibacillus sp. YYML68]
MESWLISLAYVNNERFHNVFHLREDHTGIVLTGLIEIHFLELPKLEQQRTTMNNKLVKWLLFLKGVQKDRWEELAMNEPTLRKAMDTLEFLSQDRETRQLYEMRQKALHDEVSMIAGAKEEKALEVAKNMLDEGLGDDLIMKITGLSEVDKGYV